MALHTPLFDWHQSHGGRLVEFGGWMLPVQYSGIVAEHSAVRNAVGIFDISHMGRLSFGGPDSLAVIDHAWTNDAAGMKDFQVRYGLVCNENGGIIDDVLVYRWPYGWAMVVNAANRLTVVDQLKKYIAGKQCQLEDQTEKTGMIALQGPDAVEIAADLFEADIKSLKYYYAAATKCRGENFSGQSNRVYRRRRHRSHDGRNPDRRVMGGVCETGGRAVRIGCAGYAAVGGGDAFVWPRTECGYRPISGRPRLGGQTCQRRFCRQAGDDATKSRADAKTCGLGFGRQPGRSRRFKSSCR